MDLESLVPLYRVIVMIVPNWLIGVIALAVFAIEFQIRRLELKEYYRMSPFRGLRQIAIVLLAAMEFAFEIQDFAGGSSPLLQGVAISRLVIGWLVASTLLTYLDALRRYARDRDVTLWQALRE